MGERLLPGLAIIGLIVVILLAMWLAWRARGKRDAGIALPDDLPARGITPVLTAETLYVATTKAEQPLERVVVRGLAFRARADLIVADEGILIAARGADPVFIAASRIEAAGPATWTIDRVVERDGLIMVRWSAGDDRLDSYLRIVSQSDHRRVLDAIASIQQTASEATRGESENNE